MYSKEIEAQKARIKLTPLQKELLVGTLLGDGHLETQDGGRTYRLKIEHSFRQKAYVDWLFEEFRTWVRTPPQKKERRVIFRGIEGLYQKYWFNTLSTGSLRFYAHQFYEKGTKRKTVPRLIHRWLTPRALAVWFMDDWSIKSNAHRIVLLNTHGFNRAEHGRLQQALRRCYGIVTTIRDKKDGMQLYVGSQDADSFLRIIVPHVIPSMRYKLPKVWLTSLPKK